MTIAHHKVSALLVMLMFAAQDCYCQHNALQTGTTPNKYVASYSGGLNRKFFKFTDSHDGKKVKLNLVMDKKRVRLVESTTANEPNITDTTYELTIYDRPEEHLYGGTIYIVSARKHRTPGVYFKGREAYLKGVYMVKDMHDIHQGFSGIGLTMQ